jgi:hypothetical protein
MKKVKVSYINPSEPQKGIHVVMDMGFYSQIESIRDIMMMHSKKM